MQGGQTMGLKREMKYNIDMLSLRVLSFLSRSLFQSPEDTSLKLMFISADINISRKYICSLNGIRGHNVYSKYFYNQ